MNVYHGLILTALILPSVLFATGTGTVDSSILWQENRITATAFSDMSLDGNGHPCDEDSLERLPVDTGRHESYSRAHRLAIEALGSAVSKLRVDPWNTLDNILQSDFETRRKVSRALENAKKRTFPSENGSGCRLDISMGEIITALPYRFPADSFPLRDDVKIPTEYSSLIIDARGLSVEPMLFPSVFNTEGLEIISRNQIDIRYALRYGMVSFVYSDDEAFAHKKAGNTPLYCVALKDMRGCPVLADRDVRRIFSSEKTLERMKKCRLIFIISRS